MSTCKRTLTETLGAVGSEVRTFGRVSLESKWNYNFRIRLKTLWIRPTSQPGRPPLHERINVMSVEAARAGEDLIGLITQRSPFHYVDSILSISPDSISGELRYNLAQPLCHGKRLDLWVCVEVLAQLAEIHTRWLSKSLPANGLLVGADDFVFNTIPDIVSGAIKARVERAELVSTFLKYLGVVEFDGSIVASGVVRIYNLEGTR